MDFTQIRELNRLINYSRSNEEELAGDDNDHEHNFKDLRATHYVSIAETGLGEIEELLKEIDMFAQSMMQAQQHELDLDFRTKAQTQYQAPTPPIQVSEEHDDLFLLPKRKEAVRSSIMGRNSTMFRASLKKNPYLKKEKRIKIFYFGNPVFKIVGYSNQSTVDDLIDRAIFAYLQDPTMDKHRIRSTKTSAYVLRILDDDSGCKADLQLEPLDPQRLVADMGFDSLVLLSNNSTQVEFNEKDESLISNSPTRANMSMVRVYDDRNEQLLTRNFNNNEKVEVVMDLILKSGRYAMDKFYLTEALDDELEVDVGTTIAKLDSKKLYIKQKKFADQPYEEEPKPVPTQNTPDKESQKSNKKLQSAGKSAQQRQIAAEECHVLTLTQASNYEQFQVIKVNTRGSRQNRVIGIDQSKLYNYDQAVHSNQKEVSLFSKMFGKSMFGTKTPERLIRDIVSVKDQVEKGCVLIECKDADKVKVLQFEAAPAVRFRIVQKLTYLMKVQQPRQ